MSKFPLHKPPSKSRAGVQYEGHDLRGKRMRSIQCEPYKKSKKSRRVRTHRWISTKKFS